MARFRYKFCIFFDENEKMKKYLSITLFIILIFLPLVIYEDNNSRYEKLSKSLLCPVCQGETLYDSPSEYADDMRIVLKEQIDNGMSDKQIMEYWTARFGERINTNPQNSNYILILFPIIFALVFGLLFYRKVLND